MEINKVSINEIQVGSKATSKKAWSTPEVELISKDHVQSGSSHYYPEGVRTPSGNYVGVS